MLDYFLITVAVTMFSVQFFFKQIYQRSCGSDLYASVLFSTWSGLVGLIAVFLINGAKFECTPFSLFLAILKAINGVGFSLCSLKALGKINLSLYSIFSMLGGMTLPFVIGILFFGEPLTLGKALCFIIITAALGITFKKSDTHSGTIYYAGIFFFNGMSGVFSKIFQASPFEKTSSAGFSVLCGIVTFLFSLILMLIVRKRSGERRKLSPGMIVGIMGSGILNRIGNLILLITLVNLPASAQYPFVTGGVMILSTLMSYFTPKKPGKREWLSVAVSFIGLMILMIVP